MAENEKAARMETADHKNPSRHSARKKITHGIYGRKCAESHPVSLLGNQFRGQRIFQRFFRADVQSGKCKNPGEQPQLVRCRGQQDGGRAGERVTGREHELTM